MADTQEPQIGKDKETQELVQKAQENFPHLDKQEAIQQEANMGPGREAVPGEGQPSGGGLLHDWWLLPEKLISNICRLVCEGESSTEGTANAWTNFALTCKAWMRGALSTHLCFNINRLRHLDETPHIYKSSGRQWLTTKTLEVVMIDREIVYHTYREALVTRHNVELIHLLNRTKSFAHRLLSSRSTIENSGRSLQALLNVPFSVAPLLSHFTNLKKLSLYTPRPRGDGSPRIPLSSLSVLGCLNQLCVCSLTGWMESGDWETVPFPPSLQQLSIEIEEAHPEDTAFRMQRMSINSGLTNLQVLSLKGDCLDVQWPQILASCSQIQLVSKDLSFYVEGGQINDPLTFAQHLIEKHVKAERLQITCGTMELYPLGSDGAFQEFEFEDSNLVDIENLLSVLREVNGEYWDLDPRVTCSDQVLWEHTQAVKYSSYVLTMEKQPHFKPRSYHFTTPVSNNEFEMLKRHPAWRLVWCPDQRALETLENPDFIQLNKYTLRRLSRCYFHKNVDLRPFEALKSLHCLIASPDLLGGIQFPAGLTLLDLEVPDYAMERRFLEDDLMQDPLEIAVHDNLTDCSRRRCAFDAKMLTGLSSLKELCLTGWYEHDLRDLPSSIACIRIINRSIKHGNRKPFDYDCCKLPRAMLPPSLREGDSNQDFSQHEEESQHTFVSDQAVHFHHNGLPHTGDPTSKLILPTNLIVQDNALVENCKDPSCPVHGANPKPHLHLVFTDNRFYEVINLRYLLESKYPMITIDFHQVISARSFVGAATLATGCSSWAEFVQLLRTSAIEILELNGIHMKINQGIIDSLTGEILHGECHVVDLREGLDNLQKDLGDVFDFKSWHGETVNDGLAYHARGYALVRKKKKDTVMQDIK